MNLAWHFLRKDANGVPVLRDGVTSAPAIGEWLEHAGEVEICRSGLHASWRAIDALGYSTWENAVACLVEVEDVGAEQNDKFVCTRRRIVAMCDADETLRVFARQCALNVAHLWSPPQVVLDYLNTGDGSLRSAAEAAAEAAARSAAEAAARSAAGAAAGDAARDKQNTMLESMLLAEMEVEL